MTSIVLLKAFSHDSRLVFEESYELGEYYDNNHPMTDDEDFRAVRGIVCIEGDFYDEVGIFYQRWRTHYASDGTLQAAERWRNDEADRGWVAMEIDLPEV